ncbi:MAG TPA: sulfurtransferase [Gammaproteobacteria bacterium]|nr:sulfurtransferase [Gammaproteobacteria bacterium]
MDKWLLIHLLWVMSVSGAVNASPLMVDTAWLQGHLNDRDLVLVDMSTDETQYQRFHIPGAIYVSYGYLVKQRKKDKVSFRISDDQFFKLLGLLGISRESHIVIYDDMGGLNAGRFYWNLERIGHKKISVVDGGLVKWILEGRKVTNKPTERKQVAYIPGKGIYNNETGIATVKQDIKQDKVTFLDVRSREEYMGYPRYKRTGHIPGARLWPWDDSVDFDNGFTFRKKTELEESLARIGVKDKKAPLVLYCHSGHRAAQAYLALRYLGYQNVKVYDGSMAEYSRDMSAPIKQGAKP